MKDRIKFGLLIGAISLLASCGGEEKPPAVAPEGGGSGGDPVPVEPPAPTVIEESLFIEVPELKKESPEKAEEFYAVVEQRLAGDALLTAAKGMVTPDTLELIGQWEKEKIFISAKHFGQVRFIIVFAVPSTGNPAKDGTVANDLRLAFSSHAKKVILEEIDKAAAAKVEPEGTTPPPGAP